MKAFVILCVLLGSSLVEAQNATCTSGVCGCCLMNRQLQHINNFFNLSYEYMSEELAAAKKALNNLKASRTSFSAVLSNATQDCNTQVSNTSRSLVKYNVVNVNLGNNYDAAQGKFIAPRKGVYSFAITLFNLGSYKSCASLMLNGNVTYTLMEKLTADTQDSASVSVTLYLEAGDEVYVEQPAGCVMCAQNNLYNTFTGYLLYAKD